MTEAWIRSEGQRQLIALGCSLRTVAQAIGAASVQSIAVWKNGTSVPTDRFRAQLEAQFGIPIASWTQPPGVEPHPAPPQPLPSARPAPPPQPRTAAPNFKPLAAAAAPNTVDDCRRLLQSVRVAAAAAEPDNRLKCIDSEARLLALLQKLEASAELREDRYCYEHPAFLRACRTIAAALEPYPAAAQAVAQALNKLGVM